MHMSAEIEPQLCQNVIWKFTQQIDTYEAGGRVICKILLLVYKRHTAIINNTKIKTNC